MEIQEAMFRFHACSRRLAIRNLGISAVAFAFLVWALIQIKTTFSTLVRGRAVVGLIDKLLPTGWRIACVATGDHCEGVWASVKACGDNACSGDADAEMSQQQQQQPQLSIESE